MSATFFNVMPNGDASKGYLPLRIVQNNGFDVNPDCKMTVTDLNTDSKNTRYRNFMGFGDGGIIFKVQVLIKETDRFGTGSNNQVYKVLDKWIRNNVCLNVNTNAMDVTDGVYIVTNNSQRLQTFPGQSLWELEFCTYTPLNLVRFKNDNSAVLEALKQAKKGQKKSKATTASKLSKCKLSSLKYSKKKKTVTCVKYMQTLLYKQKFLTKKQVDGWYGPTTLKAVKKFQKKWNKTHVKSTTKNTINNTLVSSPNLVTNFNSPYIDADISTLSNPKLTKGSTIVTIKGLNKVLPTNGKVDKATFKALCSL